MSRIRAKSMVYVVSATTFRGYNPEYPVHPSKKGLRPRAELTGISRISRIKSTALMRAYNLEYHIRPCWNIFCHFS